MTRVWTCLLWCCCPAPKCSERRNLPPGSKRVRLCLVCQAVKNMFTSGGRSYSVLISSLMRRNLPRMKISICQNLHKRACQQERHCCCCSLWTAFLIDWLTERTSWPGLLVVWGKIFSWLRLPNCLRTVLMCLLGLVLQHLATKSLEFPFVYKKWVKVPNAFLSRFKTKNFVIKICCTLPVLQIFCLMIIVTHETLRIRVSITGFWFKDYFNI